MIYHSIIASPFVSWRIDNPISILQISLHRDRFELCVGMCGLLLRAELECFPRLCAAAEVSFHWERGGGAGRRCTRQGNWSHVFCY